MPQDAETLCARLLQAEGEDTVTDALQEWGYMDASAWLPLGGIENNWTIVGNQQADATGALVEKVINSIDAVLMRECFKKGIDPEGQQAPASMAQAIQRFFGVRDGRIGSLGPSELTALADNIRLIATSKDGKGPQTEPACYLIVDSGEGQTPDAFPDTFCSLSRSNKLRIPFVQGKFNAGGTGVLPFCGEKNYQLVVSRRDPGAPVQPGDSSGQLWGFTLIRRLRPADGRRNSMFQYLAPGGKVPRFAAATINVLPDGDKGEGAKTAPKPYGRGFDHGSVVKLYDYRWRARSLLTTEGRYELQRYLQAPALPFRVTETRAYSANYYSATISGVWAELTLQPGEDSDASRSETGFPTSAELTIPGIGRLPYQIAVFKQQEARSSDDDKAPTRDRTPKRRDPVGVFFTLNGQVHGQPSDQFVSRRLQFDYLANSLLVALDCTGMNEEVREDFFMASRDRVRRNRVYEEVTNRLARELREHEGLRALNNARRARQIERSLADDKQALEVFQYLLKTDPTLATLLGVGDRLITTTGPGEPPEFKGQKFPTYFRLKKAPKGTLVKQCPSNRTIRVEWETDAANDYFARADSPGSFTIEPAELCEHWRLWNGDFTTRFRVDPDVPIGTRITVVCRVSDVQREVYPGPFETTFEIEVAPEEETVHEPGGRNGKSSKPSGKTTAPRLSLPVITEVHKDAWPEDFDEYTALRIKHGTDAKSYDFVLNVDNVFLQTELTKSSSLEKPLVPYWFKYGLALCALGVIQDQAQAKHSNGNGSSGNGLEADVDVDAIGRFSDGVARVIVPTIRSLYHGPGIAA